MNALKPLVFALLIPALVTAAHAQEAIPLAADDLQRMAIVFAPVQAVAGTDGDRVPATVISPPDVSGTLNALFEGQLQSWHVETGAEVSVGQLLATLRSEDLLLAQQMFMDAAIALSHADAALTRDQRLFDEGIIAEQRLQASKRDQQLAAVAESSARRRLSSAGFSNNELSQLQRGNSTLGQYQLKAPVAGIVSQRLVQAGAQVSDGDALLGLRSSDPLWVSARVPARLAGSLQAGSTLTLANSSATLTLRQIDKQIDSVNQTIGIQAELDAGSPMALMPGQIVTLILPPAERGVRVPAEAVVHAGEETTVYVRTSSGAEARVLQLTPSGRHYIAADGLRAGEEVVVQGAAVLKGIQLGLGGTE
ncbi:efflux RND transporter periplasmic adaptor subunit [Gammaproteobacteria bacterium LSUCC0112]|nr:efflux RND transporter periplasmic adaptor subunit [Gammaproteobacteria bacterium LSUCC0112]